MNIKVILQGLLIGIIMIIILILFQKITHINVPTWLGNIIILGLIVLFCKKTKSSN
ncbi:hypothetical protein BN000_02743 [Neobacillus massiliamazoniensis]|uniref:Uncharacterized protein n=1 Tax=Neobacillus massiliamazoniensis TaxID=1499688 RepID=A0A0U1NXT9_9BACI|nr:hypothetical protein BN000_02743 [Neobacillus massiliamazoniensis]